MIGAFWCIVEFVSDFSRGLERQPFLGVIMLLVFLGAVCILALVSITFQVMMSMIF